MNSISVLMALIRIAICGETPTETVKNACKPDVLKEVYALAAKHDLAHLVGHGISKLQLQEDAVLAKCKKAAMTALVRQTQQEYDLQKLYELLEQERILFLPLKGAVMRALYPAPWQRTSCDIDILVKKEEIEKTAALLKQAGWKQWGQSSNEITFISDAKTVLELHHSLMEDHVTMEAKDILAEVWRYTRPAAGKIYRMELPDEWFYCCHLAHMAKHVIYGGCGIRPFLDLWILDKKMPRLELPEGSGLEKFRQAVTKLSQVWFGGAPMDEKSLALQNYILSGGAYGNLKNQVEMQRVKKG